MPESFARAYSVMMTEPQGPVYMCYDAMLQEEPLTVDVPLPPKSAAAVPSPSMPDPRALSAIADKLLHGQTSDAARGIRRTARGRIREHR